MVGVTGSVGKTTTKEMIAQVLSAQFETLKTQGNFNNRVGLPKTLLELDETVQAAVIEMGMNHFGEISDLTRRAKPDAAVITNIGVAHIEYLGSREGILKAKMEITEGMTPGSPLILNGDDDMLATVDCPQFKTIYYGMENEKLSGQREGRSGGNGTDPLHHPLERAGISRQSSRPSASTTCSMRWQPLPSASSLECNRRPSWMH